MITSVRELEERFRFVAEGHDLAPNYNVAPTQSVLTVVNEDGNVGRLMRWGLIPSWAKDPSIGSRMINARSETVAEKPSFRTAFARRRCLVLADGFYEWQKVGPSKRPMRITLASGVPFAFAGLWETWKAPDDELITSCTILTTSANDSLADIHQRMPVILPQDAEEVWLDTSVRDKDVLSSLLVPYDPSETVAYEVSTLVNAAVNNLPEVINPVA